MFFWIISVVFSVAKKLGFASQPAAQSVVTTPGHMAKSIKTAEEIAANQKRRKRLEERAAAMVADLRMESAELMEIRRQIDLVDAAVRRQVHELAVHQAAEAPGEYVFDGVVSQTGSLDSDFDLDAPR